MTGEKGRACLDLNLELTGIRYPFKNILYWIDILQHREGMLVLLRFSMMIAEICRLHKQSNKVFGGHFLKRSISNRSQFETSPYMVGLFVRGA